MHLSLIRDKEYSCSFELHLVATPTNCTDHFCILHRISAVILVLKIKQVNDYIFFICSKFDLFEHI